MRALSGLFYLGEIQGSKAGHLQRNGQALRKPKRIDRTNVAAAGGREGAKPIHPKAKRPKQLKRPSRAQKRT
jgi:hypothetical protein